MHVLNSLAFRFSTYSKDGKKWMSQTISYNVHTRRLSNQNESHCIEDRFHSKKWKINHISSMRLSHCAIVSIRKQSLRDFLSITHQNISEIFTSKRNINQAYGQKHTIEKCSCKIFASCKRFSIRNILTYGERWMSFWRLPLHSIEEWMCHVFFVVDDVYSLRYK